MQDIVIEIEEVETDSKSKEAYKALRTNIEFSGAEKRIIAFTSYADGEGKSTISFLVALAFAESEKKVLFIDSDLRKSVIMERYKIHKKVKGLSDYLLGYAQLEEILYRTNIPGFHAIFAGIPTPSPTELLENKKFEILLREMGKMYDYVLIDTPPLGNVIDGAVVAKHCDAAAIIISANKISCKKANAVKRQLEMAGCPIIGAVFNRAVF